MSSRFFFTLILSIGWVTASAQIAVLDLLSEGEHLFISVKSGRSDSLQFVFDTGCTGATIDSVAAIRAGLDMSNGQTVKVGGFGGMQRYTMLANQKVEIAGLPVNNLSFILVDLSSLSATLGKRLDGIIGYEVLNRYVTKIDLKTRQLLFYNSIREVDTSGYIPIPFEFNKGVLIPRIMVTITLKNGKTFSGRAMLDTGNPVALTISAPYSNFHKVPEQLQDTLHVDRNLLNQDYKEIVADISAMDFSGLHIGPKRITVTVNPNAEPRDGYLGIIGMDILKHFHIILDYSRKVVYLKPNQLFD